MLTRLQVRGFKNLKDVDVRFGPLTCIAGLNGVGKSNLFDAILFLGALAGHTFAEAFPVVRGGENLRELFSLPLQPDPRMSFAAELLIPQQGVDDFGQTTVASSTYVRYELALRLSESEGGFRPRLILEKESLRRLNRPTPSELGFPYRKEWLQSVFKTSARETSFISTDLAGGSVRLHADRMAEGKGKRRGGGEWADFPAKTLPRTVLSNARNADEHRTAVLVRQEMMSWRLLQLEPSALRKPDSFSDIETMDATGAHLPATLYRLAHRPEDPAHAERTYAEVVGKLMELVNGARSLRVERDDVRRLLILQLREPNGLELPASSLSDGTLRFLALTVLQLDSAASGVLCLEEPENGINPERMEAMIDLLYSLAADTKGSPDGENPLRQILINTHSPIVAKYVRKDDLLFARTSQFEDGGQVAHGLALYCMEDSWRARHFNVRPEMKGSVISYLEGLPAPREEAPRQGERVIDYIGEQLQLFETSHSG